ncbi:MAG: Fe-S-containing protein [Oscillospiraceae bacterium]|nr:Fe-S-containing protein [Oscillospiraceae bacterium]
MFSWNFKNKKSAPEIITFATSKSSHSPMFAFMPAFAKSISHVVALVLLFALVPALALTSCVGNRSGARQAEQVLTPQNSSVSIQEAAVSDLSGAGGANQDNASSLEAPANAAATLDNNASVQYTPANAAAKLDNNASLKEAYAEATQVLDSASSVQEAPSGAALTQAKDNDASVQEESADADQVQDNTAIPPEGSAAHADAELGDLVILKAEVTEKAKFYPLNVDGVNMEIIAVKAPDGTIRTAFNTCQVCTGSPKAYFVQSGKTLQCQTCGNKFPMDRVGIEAGGCNPAPIFDTDKTVTDESIIISYDTIKENTNLFPSNWKQ